MAADRSSEDLDLIFKDCPDKRFSCFVNGIVCNSAPCILAKDKFGIHERIIEHYLDKNDFNSAYYYHLDLVHLFNVNCEIQPGNEDKFEKKDMSAGCRVFKELDEIDKLRKTIKKYSSYNPKDLKNISKKGTEQFDKAKVKFISLITANMKRLGRLVMDIKNTRFDRSIEHDRVLEYYEKSFEAAKKYGMPVNPPDIFEQAFSKAAERANTLTKAHADVNKDRIAKAKSDIERDKLIKEIKEQILKTGSITPELQEKLKELQNDGDL